jgi:hypothetical protein
MDKTEAFRLTQEALGGVNRVIATFESLAPQGDALLLSQAGISDDDALFFGRVSSALALLRATANRLVQLSTEIGVGPKLIEMTPQPKHYAKEPKQTLNDKAKLAAIAAANAKRRAHAKGYVSDWILKRLARAPMPLRKSELVAYGVEHGLSDPALYHNINRLIGEKRILVNDETKLYLNPEEAPGNQ